VPCSALVPRLETVDAGALAGTSVGTCSMLGAWPWAAAVHYTLGEYVRLCSCTLQDFLFGIRAIYWVARGACALELGEGASSERAEVSQESGLSTEL
jgi:hypothetical protein